jgi:regulator of PEP synthase PpsR (kinase-PPPase family)
MRHVLAVSDATGVTCELVVKAALAQFHDTTVHLERIANVLTVEQVAAVFEKAASLNGIVIFTMVSSRLREKVLERSQATGVPAVDVLGPLLLRLTDLLEISPLAQPGLMHHLDDHYFKRIAAMDFTVKHDDGLGAHLGEAEIVLVGVSRASKTPTSVYLAYRGWKVANVPIVVDVPLPEALFRIDQNKIVGLSVDSRVLRDIRSYRRINMGDAPLDSYTSIAEIQQENVYAQALFQRHGWPHIDATHKSIEEIATDVMRIIGAKTGQRRDSIPPRSG